MRVLVTGGAGFIGSHLVDRLIVDGHKVIVFDNLSKGKLENVNVKADFVKVDITSKKLLITLKKIRPNFVFHLAAQTNIGESFKNPLSDIKTNLIATKQLINAIREVNVKKIIFASSAAIYKPTEQIPMKEDAQKEPISLYGISKLCSEFLLMNNYLLHKMPFVSLRLANVYGERQNAIAEGGVVAVFIRNIIISSPFKIYGDGKQTRDFIYIADVIRALIDAAKENVNGVFNVGTARETSVNNLIDKISKISKIKARKKYTRLPYLEVKRNALSYEKFKKHTGWMPEISLEEGLRRTYQYFKNS